ncbi:glutathione S-transferase family protein [Bartonella sp. LJL80]
MTDLTLYTHPRSRGRTVRWMLEECGADYDVRYLTYNGTMKAPEYLKINPMGKVPALVHGHHVITETSAIITYLADIYPDAELAPQNRADYYRWLFFISGPLEAALMDAALKIDVPAEMQLTLGYGSLGLAIKTLENWLQDRRFIAGDTFSAADIYAVAALHYGTKSGLLQSAIFDSYCREHLERAAFLKASQIDDAKLEEMTE